MNPTPAEKNCEIASNLVMTTLSLMLVVGYFCLFQLFRADRQETRTAVSEQQAVAPDDESLSYQESE